MGKKVKRKNKPLKDQQKKFCQLWVINFDYGQAWLDAGYKAKSHTVARASAARFVLQNVTAQKYIQKLLSKQETRSEKSADDVIRELEFLGFSNIQDFVGTDGDGEFIFHDWEGISREKLAAIESVKVTSNTTRDKNDDSKCTTKNIQFKLHSKLGALDALAKRYGLFAADNAQKAAKILLAPTINIHDPRDSTITG